MSNGTGKTTQTQSSGGGQSSGNGTSSGFLKDNLAPIIAILVLIAYAVFIFKLLTMTDMSEAAWSRAIYLFGGTEAIAFAAAGFFFGNQVQRQQTTKAENNAATANSKKEAAEQKNKQLEMEKVRTDERIGMYRGMLNDAMNKQQNLAPQAANPEFGDMAQKYEELFPSKTQ